MGRFDDGSAAYGVTRRGEPRQIAPECCRDAGFCGKLYRQLREIVILVTIWLQFSRNGAKRGREVDS